MINKVLANFKNKSFCRKCIFLVLAAMLVSMPLYAKKPLTFSSGEAMTKLCELPAEYGFAFGVIYKQFELSGLPIWNYDKRFCGYVDEANYFALTQEEANNIINKENIKLPPFMGIPYWDLFGYKLTIILTIVIFLGLYYFIANRMHPDSEE